MARARNIKPGFFTNEDLCSLPPITRLLFIGLWTEADKEGRLEDRPMRLKMRVFPADAFDIEEALAELARLHFIIRYSVGKEKFIQVTAWQKHQRPHHLEKNSIIPGCNCSFNAKSSNLPDLPFDHNGSLTQESRKLLDLPLEHNGSSGSNNALIPDTRYLIPDSGSADSGKPAQPRLALSLEVDPQQELRKLAEHLVQLLPAGGDTQLTAKALEYEFGRSASFDGDVIRFVASVRDKAAKWREAWDTNPDLKRQRAEYWVKDATYTRSPPQKAAVAQSFGRREHIPQVAPRDKGRVCPRCEGLRTIFNGVMDESLTLKEIDALTVPCPECAV